MRSFCLLCNDDIIHDMDRIGQTWNCKDAVFTVLGSSSPTTAQLYWKHTIVYLNYARPEYVGTKQVLEEAVSSPFESYASLVRVT